MPDDVIKAKIVFDTKGIAGAFGGGDDSKKSKGGIGFGKLVAGVAGGNALLAGIKKGIGAIVESSPRLQAMLEIFKKSIMLILRPIGDVVSIWLKPFLIKFLQFGIDFYKDYKTGGFWAAFKNALGSIDWGAALKVALGAGLTFTLGKMGLAALAKAFGLAAGAVGAGGLIVPMALALGALVVGDQLGFSDFQTALLATLGVGAYLLGGTAVAIPITIAIAGLIWGANKSQEALKEWAIDAGLSNPEIGDGGFTADMMLNVIINPEEAENRKKLKDFIDEGLGGKSVSEFAQESKDTRTPGGMISGLNPGDVKASSEEGNRIVAESIEKTKGMWGKFTGWLKGIFIDGSDEGGPITGYAGQVTQSFKDQEEPLNESFTNIFQKSLVDENLNPSIEKTDKLYDRISRLNRTVTTTHIIKTVRVDG